MKGRSIKVLVWLAALSVVAIASTQVFWILHFYKTQESQFNSRVTLALKDVADEFFQFNEITPPSESPVEQLAPGLYALMLNNPIDAAHIEYLLRSKFQAREILVDFEYSIYDCNTQNHVFSNLISTEKSEFLTPSMQFPQLSDEDYYASIYFPEVSVFEISQALPWISSIIALLVVISLFTYTLAELAKQKRLSQIQNDFINNMTHEFKTPISTIAVSAEVLKNEDISQDPNRLQNYAGIIQSEVVRLQNQVDRVLQLARVSEPEPVLKIEDVNIKDLIEVAVESFRANIEERSGSISFRSALSPIVRGDAVHLSNMLYNLLDSAIKYCKGAPKISVRLNADQYGVEISIKDNGIGISPEHLNRVFDRFYRVTTGNVHDQKGFGLGLNYVKLVVESHEGSIKTKSSPAGTIFTIQLPYGD